VDLQRPCVGTLAYQMQMINDSLFPKSRTPVIQYLKLGARETACLIGTPREIGAFIHQYALVHPTPQGENSASRHDLQNVVSSSCPMLLFIHTHMLRRIINDISLPSYSPDYYSLSLRAPSSVHCSSSQSVSRCIPFQSVSACVSQVMLIACIRANERYREAHRHAARLT